MDEIVTIELFGEEFKFKLGEQIEDARTIAVNFKEYVTQAEQHIKYASSDRKKLTVLLLAGMNLAKDYHMLKEEHSKLEEKVTDKISSLIRRIDTEISKN